MKSINDPRIQIAAGLVFFFVCLADLLIQEKKISYDIRFSDMTIIGKVSLVIFCVIFAYFIMRPLIAWIKQLLK
jgi:hypothetical protein